MSVNKKGNYKYDGLIPEMGGDIVRGQDLIRDHWYNQDRIGKVLLDLGETIPIIISGGEVTKGAGDTLNIIACIGYHKYQIEIPDSFGSIPPTKMTSDVDAIRVESVQQTNMIIASAILDGSAVNYVKLKYTETNGNTRQRSKKVGIYSYELIPSFQFVVDTVAPTEYEICLKSFVGTAGGVFTFSDVATKRRPSFSTEATFSSNSDLKYLSEKAIQTNLNSIRKISARYSTSAWTARSTTIATRSVCYSPELKIIVAVGNNTALSSIDGITWTTRTMPTGNFAKVCWSPELNLFIACGNDTNTIARSSNGINWTGSATPAGNWRGICWSAELGLFAMISYNSSATQIITSPDGINWTLRNTTATDYGYDMCYSPELCLFVAVYQTSAFVLTSPDGINWTRRTCVGTGYLCITWSPEMGLFCAAGQETVEIMTSPDGINWTARANSVVSASSICWSADLGLFLVVGSISSILRVSYDGITWFAPKGVPSTLDLNGCVWCSHLGHFIIISQNATNKIWVSQ